MSKISDKKTSELYETVHEEIMQSRIKISMLLKAKGMFVVAEEVDDIMSDLHLKAPQKAIDLFKPKKP